MSDYFKHESAYVDEGAVVGTGTKIWHFSHIMKGARIGARCVFGQNVNVDGGVVVGDNVKVQNNVSIYTGTAIEDDVFLGPSCVLTNVTNPRSQVNRHRLYEQTRIRRGATIGTPRGAGCFSSATTSTWLRPGFSRPRPTASTALAGPTTPTPTMPACCTRCGRTTATS